MRPFVHLSLAILSGLLFAFAWPERGWDFLIFFAFVPLFFIQQRLGDRNRGGIFWYAWLSFLIWNVLTTWWIWYSTDVGSLLAMGLNSLFVAIVFYVFHLSKKKLYQNRRGFFILLFYWISWEYFHMNWDLTWSWLNLGNVFANSPAIIQWYEITGTLGGTAWVILVNIMVYHLIHLLLTSRHRRKLLLQVSILIFLVLAPVTYSLYLYNNYEEVYDPVEVVVVQPNTDPYNEQYERPAEELLQKNLDLASEAITDSTVFVLFPESTMYDGVNSIWENALSYAPLVRQLKAFIREYPQISVIIGASTYREIMPGEQPTHAARKFRNADGYYYSYNTALFMDSTDYAQIHHKSKLTPGVEIMPSWGILKPLERLAIDLGGMTGTLGTEDHPVVFTSQQDIVVSPIICYESIYGAFVSKTIREGAQAIFIITNDGWWGNTPGHRQHNTYAALRAIETRRSIARSANTGISSIINQRGDFVQQTRYWEQDVIVAKINLNNEKTYYVKNGDYVADISIFVSALLVLLAITRTLMRKRSVLS
jgi:apolipoprotein N-acyltransferase